MLEYLYPLPTYRYDASKKTHARVDRFSTVRFDPNNYSVPADYCGKEVTIKALPEKVQILNKNNMIAEHNRCLSHKQYIYTLEHYLPILEHKGRAIFYAKPVKDNGFLDKNLHQNSLYKSFIVAKKKDLKQ